MEELKKYYGKNFDKVMAKSKKECQTLKDDFLKKYPNADINKFEFQVTTESGHGTYTNGGNRGTTGEACNPSKIPCKIYLIP